MDRFYKFARNLIMLLALLIFGSGFLMQYSRDMVYANTSIEEYIVVSNIVEASGEYAEGVDYYILDQSSRYVLLESYTIGDIIPSDVYMNITTYSVYRVDNEGQYQLIYEDYSSLGNTGALDRYSLDYALLGIVLDADSSNISISFGLSFDEDGVYGVLKSDGNMTFGTLDHISIYGKLQMNNGSNNLNHSIYISAGTIDSYADIESHSKYAFTIESSGVLDIHGGSISSDSDRVIYITSSASNPIPVSIDGGSIINTATGSAIYNDSSVDISIKGGSIVGYDKTITNSGSGDIIVLSESDSIHVEATAGYAIYNYLSSNITIDGTTNDVYIIGNGSGTIYLNKGDISIKGATIENSNSGANNIYLASNQFSHTVSIESSEFILPMDATGYHVYSNSIGENYATVYIGESVTHTNGVFVFTKKPSSIYATSISGDTYHLGQVISIYYYGSNMGEVSSTDQGKVIVEDVREDNKDLFTLVNTSNFILKYEDNNLVISYMYRVTYNINGADAGETPIDDTYYDLNDIVVVKESNLSKIGYRFMGWTYLSTTYVAGDTIECTRNITLTAKWQPIEYTITYMFEGAEYGSAIYTISSTYIDVPKASKAGYDTYWTMSGVDYYGWETDKKYTGRMTINKYYGDITLTAGFDIIEYTVTFISNSETLGEYTRTYNVESKTFSITPIIEAVDSHYLGFIGHEYTYPTKTITIATGSTGDRVYTARFEAKSYIYYIENLEGKYHAYSYTENDVLYEIAFLDSIHSVISAIDMDRYVDRYIDATIYLGLVSKPIVLEDIDPLVFENGKYTLYGSVDYRYAKPIRQDKVEYGDVVEGGYTTYGMVISSSVDMYIKTIHTSNGSAIYVEAGGNLKIYGTSIETVSIAGSNAINNLGIINIERDTSILYGNIDNRNVLNIKASIILDKTNKIINRASVSLYDGASVILLDTTSTEFVSMENNGLINLNGSVNIANTISTIECATGYGIYASDSYEGTLNLILNIDIYKITKFVDNISSIDTINVVDVVETLETSNTYDVILIEKDVYLKRVYTITYDYVGGSGIEESVYRVLDQETYTIVDVSLLAKTGYEVVGVYRYVDSMYVDSKGNIFTTLYDTALQGNSWTQIDSVEEDYVFYIKWQIIAPIIENNNICISDATFTGENYIYVTITNEITIDKVEYTYTWYKGTSSTGTFSIVETTDIPRLYIRHIEDKGFYYVVVTISDDNMSKTTTSNKKNVSLDLAVIKYKLDSVDVYYDGMEHSIRVYDIETVYDVPYTITYSLDGVTFVDTNYTYTNHIVDKVIYFKITAIDHVDMIAEGNINIKKAPIIITGDSISRYYKDDIASVTASITSGTLVNENDLGVIGATTDVDNLVVGEYDITPTYTPNDNYDVTVVDGVYAVTKRPLSISIQDKVIVYGTAVTEYTLMYSGFASGDSESILSGTPIYTTAYTTSKPVGNYIVNISGYSSEYYDIAYHSGKIIVQDASIVYTVIDYVGVYDVNYHSVIVTDISVVNNISYRIMYSVDGGRTFTSTTPESYRYVTYKETWFKITAYNHEPIIDKGIVDIRKKPITVQINDSGGSTISGIPSFSSRVVEGELVGSDTINSLRISYSTNMERIPGRYDITATSDNINYDVTFIKGTYTVTAIHLNSEDEVFKVKSSEGLSPDIEIAYEDTYEDNLVKLDITSIAGENTEVVRRYKLKVIDTSLGVETTLPNGTYTIGLKIPEEYIGNKKFTVMYYLGNIIPVDLNARVENGYLVFDTAYIGEYYLITEKSVEYLNIPIAILSVILLGLIILYILQCTKFKDSEIRFMSMAPLMLSIYIPFTPKVVLLILIMLNIFMIFANGIKIMSRMTIDMDSVRRKKGEMVDIEDGKKDIDISSSTDVVEEDISIDKLDTSCPNKPTSKVDKKPSSKKGKKKKAKYRGRRR